MHLENLARCALLRLLWGASASAHGVQSVLLANAVEAGQQPSQAHPAQAGLSKSKYGPPVGMVTVRLAVMPASMPAEMLAVMLAVMSAVIWAVKALEMLWPPGI